MPPTSTKMYPHLKSKWVLPPIRQKQTPLSNLKPCSYSMMTTEAEDSIVCDQITPTSKDGRNEQGRIQNGTFNNLSTLSQ